MQKLMTDKFQIKDPMQPSDWAEANVIIPESNARPGPLSFRDSPFQKSILNAVLNRAIERIVIQSAAQIGKTLLALCILGYFTDEKPMSQMFMQPTETDMDKWLSTKFNRMLQANQRLANLYAPPRGREGVNNRNLKEFRGGELVLAWAGSNNTQRGVSAPIIICDEVDGYEYSEEGHPVDLIWRRSATFGGRRKLIELSTPTVVNESRIEQDYLLGDMRHYEVVCQHCLEGWIFAWEHVKYDEKDVSSAQLHCPHCDTPYNDTERIQLVRYAEADGGGWKPQRQTKGTQSYQLSALYSPLQRLKDIVQVFVDAADDPKKIATFYNTCMGVTWEKSGETAEAHALESRCEDYKSPVPLPVKILTAGIDVQKDRLECEIVGWSTGEESWNIAYEVFYGDTSNWNDYCYRELWKFLNKGFEVELGGRMFVQSATIDSGFNTIAIYNFVRQHQSRIPAIYAVKGIGGWNREVLKGSKPTQTYRGYRPALFSIGVDIAKRILMHRLNIETVGQGYCHFPQERAEGEYFTQLTSEVLVYDPKTGKRKWEKKDTSVDNEALDCRVYAFAALHILQPDLSPGSGRHGYLKGNQTASPGYVQQVKSFS